MKCQTFFAVIFVDTAFIMRIDIFNYAQRPELYTVDECEELTV